MVLTSSVHIFIKIVGYSYKNEQNYKIGKDEWHYTWNISFINYDIQVYHITLVRQLNSQTDLILATNEMNEMIWGRGLCLKLTNQSGFFVISEQCTSDEFQCRSDRKCIDRRRYCDSRQDCDDGSDEEDCRKFISFNFKDRFQKCSFNCMKMYII